MMTMKKISLLFLISALFLVFGCKKKLTQFNMDNNFEATIPASSPVDLPFNVYTPEQETNSEFEFESNDTRKDKIEQIVLQKLEITIISPEGEDFSFLNSMEVYLSSPNHSEEKVAFLEDIPDNIGGQINCEIVGQDLQKYVKEDKFKIRLITVTDEVTSQDIDVNIYTDFFVDAKLIK